MRTNLLRGWLSAAALMVPGILPAEPLEIFIDGDYSISSVSAEAIELGVSTALAEVGYRIAEQDVVLRAMDHRGNVKRSRRNLEEFERNDRGLAVIGGVHSPPYLTHQDYINERGLPLLLPWSAAGPITRAPEGSRNWIFRLSVDDTQSGAFFVEEAVTKSGCSRVALVLLKTGWGRANEVTLTKALKDKGLSPSAVAYFPRSIGHAAADTLAEDVARSQADCAVLLAGWVDGSIVSLALAERMPELRLFSHWGILGGPYHEHVPHEVRVQLNLSILQTCGLKREADGSVVLARALKAAFGSDTRLGEVPASAGFVHGYDLTRVLIAAAEQAAQTPAWSQGNRARRAALREALEHLQTPVDGILTTYDRPYAPYEEVGSAAHEALGLDDLCTVRFDANGQLEDAG